MYYVTSPSQKAHTKKGTIIVNKKALGGDTQFKFTKTGGDDLPASFIITTSGGAGSKTFTNVKPGATYNITEIVPSGWILTASNSTTGTPSSFVVGAGQTVTVNFTDTAKNGTIIVNKTTVGGEWSFSFTGIGDSRLRAGFHINTSSGHGTMTFTNVTPGGGYGIFETVPAGWVLTNSKSSSATSVGTSGRFAVAPGDTVYVNFTDTRFPRSIVTDSSLSYFDLNHIHNNGQQFRLIFTTNPINKSNYKLTASNPDQIYYNVFYIGSPVPKTNVSLNISIPYPFVTDGSDPISVYSNVNIHDGNFVPSGSFVPSDEITRKFTITGTNTKTPSGRLGIKLTDYNSSKQSVTITVTGPVPTSGLVYVNLHLDYGLMGTVNYTNARNDDALNASNPSQVVIPNNGSYIFRVSGSMIDNQTILNENVFNRIPDRGGKVEDRRSNPRQGFNVQVYNLYHKLLAEFIQIMMDSTSIPINTLEKK
jgi:hypothetical protein